MKPTLEDIQALIPNFKDDALYECAEEIMASISNINLSCRKFVEYVESLRPIDGTLLSARFDFKCEPCDNKEKPLQLSFSIKLLSNVEDV